MAADRRTRRISRRDFIRVAALASGASVLAACSQSAPPAPVPTAPPSSGTKPAAAPTTAAPAPAATSAAPAPAASGGVKGGTLRAAIIGEPPSLDPQWTTATVTANISWHYVEALFTLDADFKAIPMLAESLETSSDGLTRTVKLRKGVLFHNGKEMTAEDVDASLKRWAQISGLGKNLFAKVDTVSSPDKYTMVFKMKSPYAIFDAVLGYRSGGAAIMPKEVVEQATEKNQVTNPIGTGPYRFVEQLKDRYTRVVRWEKYQSNGDTPSGPGGKKNAYFDEIRFIPVPDQNVRIAGIQSGDYDYAEGINTDQYSLLKDNKQVTTLLSPPSKTPLHYFNNKSAIMSDQKLRQAILAAIDPEAALKAAWATTDFYRLSPSLMLKETPWYTEAGKEFYNQKNPDKARQLLKESKYNGETIRYMTTREYPTMYQESVVLNQQMQAIGLKTDLQVIDWATLVSRRSKPEEWEIFSTWHGFVQDPSMMDWNNTTYPGWWTNEKVDALRDKLLTTLDQKGRLDVLSQEQQLFWSEDVPLLKLGDVRDLYLTSPKLKDVGLLPYTMFWNAYLTK